MSQTEIHPTAIVSKEARLGARVSIGAYAIIEGKVELGDDCQVFPHAQVLAGCRIGNRCSIGRGAVIGGDPQALSFDMATPSFVEIGARNVLREHVTIHRSMTEGESTRMGDDNFLMVGSHLGHDVDVGDHNVIANAVLLAGHVEMGNYNYLGGASVFHQFIRIGDYCMAQGNSSISQDIPHYTTVSQLNILAGLNVVGLRRAGFSPAERKEIKELFRLVFASDNNVSQGVANARERQWSDRATNFLEFVSNPSKRGFCSRE